MVPGRGDCVYTRFADAVQLSVAGGRNNGMLRRHRLSRSTVIVLVGQAITGFVVSCSVIVCEQVVWFEQQSVTSQVRTIVFVQLPLVEVLRTTALMFEPQQELTVDGVA